MNFPVYMVEDVADFEQSIYEPIIFCKNRLPL